MDMRWGVGRQFWQRSLLFPRPLPRPDQPAQINVVLHQIALVQVQVSSIAKGGQGDGLPQVPS